LLILAVATMHLWFDFLLLCGLRLEMVMVVFDE